jgi:hypothetical protein
MKTKQKLAIHELLSRAAYYFDLHDVENLQNCFTEDANMLVNIAGGDTFGPFEGRDAIMGLMSGTLDAQTDTRRHIICDFFFESEGKKDAVVVSTLVLTSVENGAISLVTSGVYRDTVKRVDGKWLFTDRLLDLDMPF